MPEDRVRTGFDGTERLAKRVLDGEVLFFVGSGFSIDSEKNDAKRLVGRLLAAILAMGTILGDDDGEDRSQAAALLDRLRRIFSIPTEGIGDSAKEPARTMTDANLKLLAREYYNFNDWATSALSVLSGQLIALPEPHRSEAARKIQKLATFLLGLVGDPVPLDPIDTRALSAFQSEAARGKALFLDTMGFANTAIMAGTPLEADIERVARSYDGRLRPRHHALARLAREGLAPALITTNYDLLIEGAYRLAGFVERQHAAGLDETPSDRLPRFSTIAGADQFFARGQGYRTSLLLKIHGCVQAYREARQRRIDALPKAPCPERQEEPDQPSQPRSPAERDPWTEYLPALVFTYREIQTWRTDAWSRDLIRTILRTHTIALCGYSGADPVMHSTFREVYDERTSVRGLEVKAADTSPTQAPVFFFGLARRREFHSLEILRAATIAAGLNTGKLVEHPNHIEFETAEAFPTLDDHFRWMTHYIVRELQGDALSTRLRRLLPRLLRREEPMRDEDLKRVARRFGELRELEAAVIARVHPLASAVTAPDRAEPDGARRTATRRLEFERVAGWTWHFVPAFLRELSIADTVETYRGAGRAVRASRTSTYYYPLSERPDWTAWSVIVELALRSLVAALNSTPGLMPKDAVAEEGPLAAISFRAGSPWLPFALCIRMAGFERHGRTVPMTGVFHKITYWELHEQDVPWPSANEGLCPSPQAMWDWASGQRVPTPQEAAHHLGVPL